MHGQQHIKIYIYIYIVNKCNKFNKYMSNTWNMYNISYILLTRRRANEMTAPGPDIQSVPSC